MGDELGNDARHEIVSLARRYTSEYRDVDFRDRNQDTIIMSGHQPTLYHAGVWYKNFALSHLGQRLNCLAINLVVDNDICGVASIRVPQFDGDHAVYKMLAVDAPGDNLPFEERRIADRSVFDSFGRRAAEAIKPIVDRPIVNQLWPKTVPFADGSSLGTAISKGRHQLEAACGLTTLEVPLSQVATTSAFAKFAHAILTDIELFSAVYNQSLVEYRLLHKIRSNSHPVPALERIDDWHETPFWIWEKSNPVRRSLFVKRTGQTIFASDKRKLRHELPENSFESAFVGLSNLGIAVRPKALMTTMFTRLTLCDLFIHGIGGSKYDQLTDQIIRKFFGIEPPEYMTLTATMKLHPRVAEINRQQIVEAEKMLRELGFHPEDYLNPSREPARTIVNEKLDWIAKALPKGKGLERHLAITKCNSLLQPFVESTKTQIQRELKRLRVGFRSSQVLHSREYSFCLHDERLIEQLHQMAK